MNYEGYNGQIELLEDKLVIHRGGAMAFLGHGFKGDKSIPYASITAVQFKEAGMMLSGYIQFSILGGVESRGGLAAATQDENSVLIRSNHNKAFKELKDVIERRIAAARAPAAQAISPADEIAKLAALHEKGLLSDEEFVQAKKKILRT